MTAHVVVEPYRFFTNCSESLFSAFPILNEKGRICTQMSKYLLTSTSKIEDLYANTNKIIKRAYAIRPYRNIVKYSPRSHVFAKILVHPRIPSILVHTLILVHPRIPSILVQLLNTSIPSHPFITQKKG